MKADGCRNKLSSAKCSKSQLPINYVQINCGSRETKDLSAKNNSVKVLLKNWLLIELLFGQLLDAS